METEKGQSLIESVLSGYGYNRVRYKIRDAEYEERIEKVWRPRWYVKILRHLFAKEWESECDIFNTTADVEISAAVKSTIKYREKIMEQKLWELGYRVENRIFAKAVADGEDYSSVVTHSIDEPPYRIVPRNEKNP